MAQFATVRFVITLVALSGTYKDMDIRLKGYSNG